MSHVTIVEAFNNCLYRIPDYQRGYSWEKQQLEDFWQDLSYINLNDVGAIYRHFYGTITLDPLTTQRLEEHEEVKNDTGWLCSIDGGGHKGYFIVDGQQRLTTVMILLGVLIDWADKQGLDRIGESLTEEIAKTFLYRKRITDGSRHYLFGYEADDPSYTFWRDYIMGPHDINDKNVIHTTYTRRLKEAYCFFYEKINEEYSKRETYISASEFDSTYLKNIYHKTRIGLVVNLDILSSEFTVGIAFETMNNRGKKLSLLELLKNRLIYLATRLNDFQLRHRINKVWRVIYNFLGKDDKLNLDDEDFIKTHYIVYFGYDTKSDQYHNGLLNIIFSPARLREADGLVELKSDVEKYISSLELGIKMWFEYHSCSPDLNRADRQNLRIWFQNIKYLGYGSCEPLMLAALMYTQNARDGYCEAATHRLVGFIKSIERFRFIAFHVFKSKAHLQRNSGYQLARELFQNKISIAQATEIIQSWVHHIAKTSDAAKQRFSENIRDILDDDNGQGFYKWDGIRYFLYRYEMSLKGDAEPVVAWECVSSRTIEHICPQQYTAIPYWKERLNGYQGKEYIFIHSLGNLALCSKDANSTYGNRPYIDQNTPTQGKKEMYSHGSFSLRKISEKYPKDWGPDQINDRTKEMLRFLLNNWNIDNLPGLDYNYHWYQSILRIEVNA